jgi:hypothetical protein
MTYQQKESLKIVMEILARYLGGEQTEVERNIEDCYNFYKNRALLSPEAFLELQSQTVQFSIPSCRYFLKQSGIDARLLRERKETDCTDDLPELQEFTGDVEPEPADSKKKVVCECGKEMLKRSLTSHKKTKRHLALIEMQANK